MALKWVQATWIQTWIQLPPSPFPEKCPKAWLGMQCLSNDAKVLKNKACVRRDRGADMEVKSMFSARHPTVSHHHRHVAQPVTGQQDRLLIRSAERVQGSVLQEASSLWHRGKLVGLAGVARVGAQRSPQQGDSSQEQVLLHPSQRRRQDHLLLVGRAGQALQHSQVCS